MDTFVTNSELFLPPALCGYKKGDDEFVHSQNQARERMTCAIGLDVHYELDMASDEGALEEKRLQPFNPRISGPACPYNFTGKFVPEDTYKRLIDDPIALGEAIEQQESYDPDLYRVKDPRLTTATAVIRDFGCKVPIDMVQQEDLARAILNWYPDQYIAFLNEFVSNLFGAQMKKFLASQMEGYRRLLENPAAVNRLSWTCYVSVRGKDAADADSKATDVCLKLSPEVMQALQRLADNGTGMTSNVSSSDMFDLRPCIESHIQTLRVMHDEWCQGFATTEHDALTMMYYANEQGRRLCWDRRLVANSDHPRYDEIRLHVPVALTETLKEYPVAYEDTPDRLSTIHSKLTSNPKRQCAKLPTRAFSVGRWSGSDDAQNVFLNTITPAPFRWGWGHPMNLFHHALEESSMGGEPRRFLGAAYLKYTDGIGDQSFGLSTDYSEPSYTYVKSTWQRMWHHENKTSDVSEERDELVRPAHKPTYQTLRSQLLASKPDISRGEGAMHAYRGAGADAGVYGAMVHLDTVNQPSAAGDSVTLRHMHEQEDNACDDDSLDLFLKPFINCGEQADPFLSGGGCIALGEEGHWTFDVKRLGLYSLNALVDNAMARKLTHHLFLIVSNNAPEPKDQTVEEYLKYVTNKFDQEASTSRFDDQSMVLKIIRNYLNMKEMYLPLRILAKGPGDWKKTLDQAWPRGLAAQLPIDFGDGVVFSSGLFNKSTVQVNMANAMVAGGIDGDIEKYALKIMALRKSIQYSAGPVAAYVLCRDPLMLMKRWSAFEEAWKRFDLEGSWLSNQNAHSVPSVPETQQFAKITNDDEKPTAAVFKYHLKFLQIGTSVALPPVVQLNLLKFMWHNMKERFEFFMQASDSQMQNILTDALDDFPLLSSSGSHTSERLLCIGVGADDQRDDIGALGMLDVVFHMNTCAQWKSRMCAFMNMNPTFDMSSEIAMLLYSSTGVISDPIMMYTASLQDYCKDTSIDDFHSLVRSRWNWEPWRGDRAVKPDLMGSGKTTTIQNPTSDVDLLGNPIMSTPSTVFTDAPMNETVRRVSSDQMLDHLAKRRAILKQRLNIFEDMMDKVPGAFRGAGLSPSEFQKLQTSRAGPVVGPAPNGFDLRSKKNVINSASYPDGIGRTHMSFIPLSQADYNLYQEKRERIFDSSLYNSTLHYNGTRLMDNRPQLFSMFDASALMWNQRCFWNPADSHRPVLEKDDGHLEHGSVEDMHPWCLTMVESFLSAREQYRTKGQSKDSLWEELVHTEPDEAFSAKLIGSVCDETFRKLFPLIPQDHKLRDNLRRVRSLNVMWGTLPSYSPGNSGTKRGAWMPMSEAQRCALLKEVGLFDLKYKVPSNPWLPRGGQGLCRVYNQSYHSLYVVDNPDSTHYREWVRDICRYSPPAKSTTNCKYPFSQYGGTPVEADFLYHRVEAPDKEDDYTQMRHAHLVHNRFGFTKAFRLGQQFHDSGLLQDLYSFEYRSHLKLNKQQRKHVAELKTSGEPRSVYPSNFMAYARNHAIMALASCNHGTTRMAETRVVRNLYRMFVDAYEVCANTPTDQDLVPIVMGFLPNLVKSSTDRPVTMYAGSLPCLNAKLERFCNSNANLSEKVCKSYKQLYLNDAALLFTRLIRADRRRRLHQRNYRRARNHRNTDYSELDFYKELVDVQDTYVEFLQTTLLSMALESDVSMKDLPLHLLEPREVEVQSHPEDTDVVGNDFLGPRTLDLVSDLKLDGDNLSRTQMAILSLIPPNHRILGTMRLNQDTDVLDLEHLRKQIQKNVVESNKKVWENHLQKVIRASLATKFLEKTGGTIDFSIDESAFKDPLEEASKLPRYIKKSLNPNSSSVMQNQQAASMRQGAAANAIISKQKLNMEDALRTIRERVERDYDQGAGNKSRIQILMELRIPERIKEKLKSEYQTKMMY